MKIIHHFVDGKNFSGDSKRTGKVFNPATGEQSAEVKLATSKDVNNAVASAKKAFTIYISITIVITMTYLIFILIFYE